MDKQRIETPKVFISYAWGTTDYQERVLAFATDLVGDGIDVVIDKWDLSEGNDTYAFMEKCVTDPSITNVLMLLDPTYAKKADAHTGGVGTETQIISAQVYNKVDQDRFIPIVFERDAENNVCKPVYLQGRLHVDLTDQEKYRDEYTRLVKILYGVDIFPKPPKGTRPLWVDAPTRVISHSVYSNYGMLKRSDVSQSEKVVRFKDYLRLISKNVIEYGQEVSSRSLDGDKAIEFYASMRDVRDGYLMLLEYSDVVNEVSVVLGDWFEDLLHSIKGCVFEDIKFTFLHEIFIYTIAFFLKTRNYDAIGSLLNRTYFNTTGTRRSSNDPQSFDCFHITNNGNHYPLNSALNNRDKKEYYCGTAEYWVSTINTQYYSKEQFVTADMFCFNYSIWGNNYKNEWYWFPLTYVYDNEYQNGMMDIAIHMQSKAHLKKMARAFGFDESDDLIDSFKRSNAQTKWNYREYRYSRCFEVARTILDYISVEALGSVN